MEAHKTVTVYCGNQTEEWSSDDSRLRAYKALETAANRIMAAWFKALQTKSKIKDKTRVAAGKPVPNEARILVEAMPQVLSGKITPEQAMSLLWDHDTMKARLA